MELAKDIAGQMAGTRLCTRRTRLARPPPRHGGTPAPAPPPLPPACTAGQPLPLSGGVQVPAEHRGRTAGPAAQQQAQAGALQHTAGRRHSAIAAAGLGWVLEDSWTFREVTGGRGPARVAAPVE